MYQPAQIRTLLFRVRCAANSATAATAISTSTILGILDLALGVLASATLSYGGRMPNILYCPMASRSTWNSESRHVAIINTHMLPNGIKSARFESLAMNEREGKQRGSLYLAVAKCDLLRRILVNHVQLYFRYRENWGALFLVTTIWSQPPMGAKPTTSALQHHTLHTGVRQPLAASCIPFSLYVSKFTGNLSIIHNYSCS